MILSRAGVGLLSLCRVLLGLVAAAGVSLTAGAALAQGVPGYGYRHWTLADGAPPEVRAIAQTRDGFLWLGSADGLYRFDGVAFERIAPVDFDRFRSHQVTALAAAPDGSLWVGYDFGGIAVWRDGRLRAANPGPPKGSVTDIVAAPDGSIWVAVLSGLGSQLRHYVSGRRGGGHWDVMEVASGLPQGPLQRIHVGPDGSVWLAMFPRLYRLPPGSRRPVEIAGAVVNTGPAFAQDGRERLWFYSSAGLFALTGTGAKNGAKNGAGTRATRTDIKLEAMIGGSLGRRAMTVEPDGRLWIAGDVAGLELLPTRDPRKARVRTYPSRVGTLFRDREGTLWGGATDGLVRLVASPFVRLDAVGGDVRTGFATGPGRERPLYVGGDRGLYRIVDDRAERVLDSRVVNGLCAVPGRGVYALTGRGEFLIAGRRATRIAPPVPPARGSALSCVADAAGTLWQSVGREGVYRLAGRDWVREPGWPPAMHMVATGPRAFVVSQPLRLVARLEDGVVRPIWRDGAIATGFVRMLTRVDGATFIGGEAGLARDDGRRIAVLSAKAYPWLANVMGLVRRGTDYWLVSDAGVVRVAVAELQRAFARPGSAVAVTRFGEGGTIRARGAGYVADDATLDAQGRLWFATSAGVVRLDPSRIRPVEREMPVHVTRLEANERRYPLAGAVLAAGSDRVSLSYVGLSLADAEGNRYRYRLDGIDRDWVEASGRRRVDYAGLGPGTYRFRVLAATASGPWSTRGDAVAFTIQPYLWQTWWFRAGVLIAAVVVAAAVARWRLMVVLHSLQGRMEARVAERERIAGDLHDTLLQGFQGLMLRFQTVLHLTPPDSPARAAMETALERADDVLLFGRERVRGLREDAEPKDLAEVLRLCAERVLGDTLAWRVDIDGPVQTVCAPVAEEIELVVGEALANACQHAGATAVRIEIHHGRDRLSVRVVDDGVGLPETVRAAGARPGHFGLSGMRERVERLGGTIRIGNAAGRGTSVRLTLPARLAYR